MKVETKSVQLRLGEEVVGKTKITRGVIKKNEFIVVPSEKGPCNARLAQKKVEIEQVANCKIQGLSAWRTDTVIHVGKNINGDWERWPVPEGSIIGAYSRSVKRRSQMIIPRIRKVLIFS